MLLTETYIQGGLQLHERRKHKRFPCRGVVWFGENTQVLKYGTIADIARFGVAFTCAGGSEHPQTGQRLVIRLGLAQDQLQECYDTPATSRIGRVCRVEKLSDTSCRVAVNLDQPILGLE